MIRVATSGVLGIAVVLAIYLSGCSRALSPEGRAELANLAGKLAKCQGEGRASHSYEAYEACKADAGISETGSTP